MYHSNRRRSLTSVSAGAAVVLALGFASACSSKPDEFKDKRVGAMSNYAVGVDFRATTDQPLHFSMMYNNHPNYPLNEDWLFWSELEKRTNVHLDLVEAPLSDYNQKRTTLINAGQAPQIIPKTYPGQENEYVSSGAILPVSDYVNLMPNYSARVQNWNMQSDLDTLTQADGKYYNLAGMHEEKRTEYSFAVRTDLLTKDGIATPKTLDDFENMLKVLKDKECAGVAGCYPLSDRFNFAPPERPGGNLIRTIAAAFGVRAGWDYNTVSWDFNQKKYVLTAESDAYKQTLQYLNKLVTEGLLDPESFTQQDDQALQKFAQGKSFVISSNIQNVINDYRPNLKNIPGATVGMIPPPTGPMGNVMFGGRLENGIIFNADVKDSPNFVAMMQFVDWLWYSENGQEFAKWGVPGVTYTKDANGKRTLNPDITMLGFNADTATKQLQKDYGFYNGIFVYGGTRDLMHSFYSDEEQAFLDSVKDREVLPVPPPQPFDEDQQDQATQIEVDLTPHVMQESLKFILGSRSFDDWGNFVKELDGLDAQTYLGLVTDAYNAFQQR
ncbi:MAG TPA: extracellular solute-binding protein [Micromonosporaceae bacterium]|jgi:putative aldouronate transport system substrate-binding protein